jgi:hypothetical protein
MSVALTAAGERTGRGGTVIAFRLVAIIGSNIHRREVLADIRTRFKGMWR